MMAMIGIGLIAIPIANGSTSLIPWPMGGERTRTQSAGAGTTTTGRVERCTTW